MCLDNKVNSQTLTKEKYTGNKEWGSDIDWTLGLSSAVLDKIAVFVTPSQEQLWLGAFIGGGGKRSDLHLIAAPAMDSFGGGGKLSPAKLRCSDFSFSLSVSLSLSLWLRRLFTNFARSVWLLLDLPILDGFSVERFFQAQWSEGRQFNTHWGTCYILYV